MLNVHVSNSLKSHFNKSLKRSLNAGERCGITKNNNNINGEKIYIYPKMCRVAPSADAWTAYSSDSSTESSHLHITGLVCVSEKRTFPVAITKGSDKDAWLKSTLMVATLVKLFFVSIESKTSSVTFSEISFFIYILSVFSPLFFTYPFSLWLLIIPYARWKRLHQLP